MATKIVRIDCASIADWHTFHDVFAKAFGFPALYGRNMDAWIDCLTYLDDSDAGMTRIHVSKGETLSLVLDNAGDFKNRCPKQFQTLVECAAFVNWRRVEGGESPVLAVSFYA